MCYLHTMLADTLLRLLGENPAVYSRPNKWPAITAILIDWSIPLILILLFALPLLIVRWRRKKFTAVNVIASLLIGTLLAWGGWWLNQWSYGYGVGVIWHAINDPAN